MTTFKRAYLYITRKKVRSIIMFMLLTIISTVLLSSNILNLSLIHISYTGLCMDCFNGDYSAGLYDYEEDYLKSMTNIQKKFLQERGKNNE